MTLLEVIASGGSDEDLEVISSDDHAGEVSTPLKRQLGDRLRAHRLSRGLTQEGLAELVGVSARYVAGIERGERNLTLDSVDALAAHLGLDADQLLRERDDAVGD